MAGRTLETQLAMSPSPAGVTAETSVVLKSPKTAIAEALAIPTAAGNSMAPATVVAKTAIASVTVLKPAPVAASTVERQGECYHISKPSNGCANDPLATTKPIAQILVKAMVAAATVNATTAVSSGKLKVLLNIPRFMTDHMHRHSKRDCPQGGGGSGGDRACFNCGEVG